jgi:hypothetical protein
MPPRRSKRLSSDEKEPTVAEATGGEDQSPDDSADRGKQGSPKKKPARAPSRTRRRSTREKGGANAVARNALADINRGPDCPIFLMSHEILKKIWEFLDSKTKMTTTVRARPRRPRFFSPFNGSHPCAHAPVASPSASGGSSSAGKPRSSASSSPRGRRRSQSAPCKRYVPLPHESRLDSATRRSRPFA